MYLKNIVLKNIGPIEELSVELPFDVSGNPKPVIFVGENGSGKTILISHIVNFFMSLKSVGFENNELNKGKVFKVRSPGYIKSGKEFYHSKIVTKEYDFYSVEWQLKTTRKEFEKSKDPNENYDELNRIPENQSSVFYSSFQNKKDEVENLFNQNCCLYFPSNRFENPAWLNSEDWLHTPTFEDPETIAGRTKRKIIQQKPLVEIKNWFMDLLFDQNIYEIQSFPVNFPDGTQRNAWTYKDEGRNKAIREQISDFLNILFGENNGKLRLGFGPKQSRNVAVMEGNVEKVPNIFNLSTGQLCLLDIFAGIIRDYDLSGAELSEIRDVKGVVIIDEIDLHLHTGLQNSVLPELIKLFPKIQFIITTHSPLFLLGMKKTFGEEGFEVRNMPKGELITTERFSEFENAYNVLKETEKFENEIKEKIIKSTKPILFVEGDYDTRYLNKAGELLKKTEIIEKIEIRDVVGYGNLNILWKNFNNKTKLSEIVPQKIILLYDCDTNKQDEETEKVFKRVIPTVEKNIITKGIENLFDKTILKQAIDNKKAYIDITPEITKTERGDDIVIPEKWEINKDEKGNLCDWICENGTKDDFKNFEKIFEIIEGIINPENKK